MFSPNAQCCVSRSRLTATPFSFVSLGLVCGILYDEKLKRSLSQPSFTYEFVYDLPYDWSYLAEK